MEVPSEPLAERHLKWNDGSQERDILVRLWKPVFYDGHYVCDFAIDGLPRPARGHSSGVDSLQALILALSGIRNSLAPYRDDISWLGMAGSHGVPMGVPSLTGDAAEERRLERLVESEACRAWEELLAPKKARIANWRSLHDPDLDDDLTQCSTEDIVAKIRSAAITERRYREAGNEDVAAVFGLKQSDLIGALRERSNYIASLEAFTSDDDPALRLRSAQLLMPSPLAKSTLERLRDENVEPESSEAQRALLIYARAEARPRPWDTNR